MALLSRHRARNLLETTLLPALRRLLGDAAASPLGQRGTQAAGRIAQRWPGLTDTILGLLTPRQAPATGQREQRRYAVDVPDADIVSHAQHPTPPKPATELEPTHAEPTPLETALSILSTASDYRERVAAVRSLGALTDGKAESALIAALRDPSAEVAAEAVEQLSGAESPAARAALQGLVDTCDGYTSPLTRVAALRALSYTNPERVMSAVSDMDVEVSLAAIELLAHPQVSVHPGAAATCLDAVVANHGGFYSDDVQAAARRTLATLAVHP